MFRRIFSREEGGQDRWRECKVPEVAHEETSVDLKVDGRSQIRFCLSRKRKGLPTRPGLLDSIEKVGNPDGDTTHQDCLPVEFALLTLVSGPQGHQRNQRKKSRSSDVSIEIAKIGVHPYPLFRPSTPIDLNDPRLSSRPLTVHNGHPDGVEPPPPPPPPLSHRTP